MEWLLFLGAALVGWGFCHPVGFLLRRLEMWDQPNERSSHQKPVLRGGGLAVVLVLALVIIGWVHPENSTLAFGWLGALLLLGWVNFLDDRGHVAKRIRLLAQIIAVATLMVALGFSPALGLGIGFLLLSFVNFVNFIDGINGLAAGQLLLIAAGAALFYSWQTGKFTGAHFVLAVAFAGALAGFLPMNFPKPKMFLGDTGSVLLGFSCGVMIIWMCLDQPRMWLCLFPLCSYFFLEGGVTLVRRIIAGEKWWLPHREHFFHRLIRSGWSHSKTTMVIWMVQVALTLVLWRALAVEASVLWFWLAPLVAWGAFFGFAETKFRRSRKEPN